MTPPRSASAGLLMYRRRGPRVELFLVHPGGPFFARRDLGAWSIPKGMPLPDEPLLDAARREFEEETGLRAEGPFEALTPVRQRGGKIVNAWAFEGDTDPAAIVSNHFTLEWPRGSGRTRTFPEVDRAAFFAPDEARRRLLSAQVPLVDELVARLAART